MGFALRPGLHFCEVASGFVFLDLTKDRYFRLPARLENDFRNLIENPLAAGAAAPPLVEAGVLRPATFRQSLSLPRLIIGTCGPDALAGEGRGGLEVARAAASELWVSQQLRLGRLAALVASYKRSKVARTLSTPLGERGDIIRTMQRELSVRKVELAPTDRLIFDPTAGEGARLVGRVLVRGLADEHGDRHYLLVDGVDGRTHYADIGAGEKTEPTPEGAIVSISTRGGGVRAVDRTIVEVAAANDGRYSVDAHLRHDPAAQQAFAETHVRRLEAMRKLMRSVERAPDGTWMISRDHLAKVETFENRQLRSRPVDVEILSADPLEKLPAIDAATWIDRELVADAPTPLRDAGFGREVKAAQALRRQWLIAEQLAREQGGQTTYRRGMLAALQRRELLRVAGQLSGELGKPFKEAKSGDRIEGRLVRTVEMASGRHALVERSRDFTLVPWRRVLERQLGKPVAGIMRDGRINWTLGRQRSGPSIS